MSIGEYTPVREGDRFEIDGQVWEVDEIRTRDSGEPQCFLEPVSGDDDSPCRQYTEQFLLNGVGITRTERTS